MVLFPDKRSESHVRNESFSIMAFLAYSKYIDSDCFHCRYCYCLYYGASDLFWKECIRSLFFVAISSSANGCRIWFTLSVWQKWVDWTCVGFFMCFSDCLYLVLRFNCSNCCVVSAYVSKCDGSFWTI